MVPLIDGVEVEHHLDVASALQLRDRLAHRQVLGEGEDVGVHDAAGGVLGEFEEFLDLRVLLATHEVEDAARQLLGQRLDNRRGVVGLEFLNVASDVLGRAPLEQVRAHLGPELAQGLHGMPWAAVQQDVEGRLAVALGQVAEDAREIGRMLLLQQVQQVRARPDADQPLHRGQDDVDFALCHGGGCAGRATSPRRRTTHRSGQSIT